MKRILGITLTVLALSGCEFWPEPLPAPPLDIEYLEYTDYYDGDAIALKLDLTNYADKRIDRFRVETKLYYTDGGSQTFYPDTTLSILPGDTVRSHWLPVARGMIWYEDHDFGEIIVWYSDGTEESWDHYPYEQ